MSKSQIRALREVKREGSSWRTVRWAASVRSCIGRGWILETGVDGGLALTTAGADVLDAYKLGAS